MGQRLGGRHGAAQAYKLSGQLHAQFQPESTIGTQPATAIALGRLATGCEAHHQMQVQPGWLSSCRFRWH